MSLTGFFFVTFVVLVVVFLIFLWRRGAIKVDPDKVVEEARDLYDDAKRDISKFTKRP